MRLLIYSCLLVSFAATAADPLPTPVQLEERGAVIRDIQFYIRNIFDLNDPHENKALFRLANRLHIQTRESAVRAQLLFASGERYSRRLIAETERHLRSSDYLYDARVDIVKYEETPEGAFVDLMVVTRDVWTLQPGASYDRKGGESTSELEIQEENLLGYGKRIALSRSRDVERTSLMMSWTDPNIWGTRWRDKLAYASNDDGHYREINLERPFFSLDARWGAGLRVLDDTRIDPRYDLGEIVDEFSVKERFVDLYGGLSRGFVNGWTLRWYAGWRFNENLFTPSPPGETPTLVLPPNQKLSYPWVGLEWFEDRYEQTTNLNQINRTEDLYFGKSLRLELGRASTQWGSDRDATTFALVAKEGFKFSEHRLLFLNAESSGRLESGRLMNGNLTGSAQYYWRWATKRVFSMTLMGETTQRLDPQTQVLLGGDNGLRGYPLRYQDGTSRALFSMEQRFYTDWFPFRLFYVGGAIFFDAGRTWGAGPVGSESLGLLKDIGVGLRLGNARSSFGSVLHFDVAFPLDRQGDIDSVQFLVETKRSF